jgi:hypothetical protein
MEKEPSGWDIKGFAWEEFDYPIKADWDKFGPIAGEEEALGWQEEEMMDYKKFERAYFVQVGENDGDAWIFLVKHQNGYYIYFNAWCDYTGFDCQGGKVTEYSKSWEDMWRLGLPDDVRSMIKEKGWLE